MNNVERERLLEVYRQWGWTHSRAVGMSWRAQRARAHRDYRHRIAKHVEELDAVAHADATHRVALDNGSDIPSTQPLIRKILNEYNVAVHANDYNARQLRAQ